MDCNFTTIKTCELKDSTFRSRILDFGDFDISDYTFSVVYKTGFDQVISEQELTATGNILTVPLEAIEGTSNRAKAEVWMLRDGGFKDKVIVFDVVISATGCPSDASITEGVSVTFGGLTVPVEVNQGIVNISREVAFSTLTEEEKLELKGEPGPPGPQGDPLTFSDLTPQQVNELKQPAIEAAELANQAATNANTAAEAANTAAENALTGISGEATESNSPNPTGFHRYIVTTPITIASAWGIEVTQAELNNNWVFFNVKDGVITKDSKPIQEGGAFTETAFDAEIDLSQDNYMTKTTLGSNVNFTEGAGSVFGKMAFANIKGANVTFDSNFQLVGDGVYDPMKDNVITFWKEYDKVKFIIEQNDPPVQIFAPTTPLDEFNNVVDYVSNIYVNQYTPAATDGTLKSVTIYGKGSINVFKISNDNSTATLLEVVNFGATLAVNTFNFTNVHNILAGERIGVSRVDAAGNEYYFIAPNESGLSAYKVPSVPEALTIGYSYTLNV